MLTLPEIYELTIIVVTEHSSTMFATVSAVSISLLMGVHDERTWQKNISGSLTCGVLTLAITGSLEFFGLPDNAVTFIGAAIGLIGVEIFREKILTFIKPGDKGDKK